MVQSTADDDVAPAVGTRWWVPWLVGLLVSGTALAVLGMAFPVAIAVVAGYGSTLGAAWQGRGRTRARATRGHWVAAGFSVFLFVGLGLLLGAAGLSIDDGRQGGEVPGAAVGGVLFAVGGGALLAMALAVRRGRRRPATPADE